MLSARSEFCYFINVLAAGLKFFKPVIYLDISNTFLYFSLPSGSIFDLVRPTNSACNGEKGDKGSCLTSRDCGERGGHNIGVCANGLAICCYCKCYHLVTKSITIIYLLIPFSNYEFPCFYKKDK